MAGNLLVRVITRKRCGVCVAQVPSVGKIADGAGEGLGGMVGVLPRGWEHWPLRCYVRLVAGRERLRDIAGCGRGMDSLASTVVMVHIYRAGRKMRRRCRRVVVDVSLRAVGGIEGRRVQLDDDAARGDGVRRDVLHAAEAQRRQLLRRQRPGLAPIVLSSVLEPDLDSARPMSAL